jgi:hypothetical protein
VVPVRRRKRHAAGLHGGGHEPGQVPDRRAETDLQHAAEQVEPGQSHELPGVGVETANRFLPDRRPGGWAGLPVAGVQLRTDPDYGGRRRC